MPPQEQEKVGRATVKVRVIIHKI